MLNKIPLLNYLTPLDKKFVIVRFFGILEQVSKLSYSANRSSSKA